MYEIVYDVGRDYWEWQYVAVIIFMALWTSFALTMVFWRDHVINFLGLDIPKPGLVRDVFFGAHRVLAVIFSLIGIAVLTWLVSHFVGSYFDLKTAIADGRCRHIAGLVADFSPENVERRQPESFRINGVSFSYSGGVATGAFHRTGLMREGSDVRGCYVDRFGENAFLRLEVRRDH